MAKRGPKPINEFAQSDLSEKKIITAPRHLSTQQKRTWRDILKSNPHLNDSAYKELLTVYVTAFCRYVEYSKQLDEQGPILENENGDQKTNPILAAMNTQAAAVTALSTKLSLNYRSRAHDVAKHINETRGAPRLPAVGKPNLKLA